jgi:hypothetical protein
MTNKPMGLVPGTALTPEQRQAMHEIMQHLCQIWERTAKEIYNIRKRINDLPTPNDPYDWFGIESLDEAERLLHEAHLRLTEVKGCIGLQIAFNKHDGTWS